MTCLTFHVGFSRFSDSGTCQKVQPVPGPPCKRHSCSGHTRVCDWTVKEQQHTDDVIPLPSSPVSAFTHRLTTPAKAIKPKLAFPSSRYGVWSYRRLMPGQTQALLLVLCKHSFRDFQMNTDHITEWKFLILPRVQFYAFVCMHRICELDVAWTFSVTRKWVYGNKTQ